jgi:AcrR family transcriptional regulator
MDNFAVAAGMSRPTLYLVFPNKEEIFAAAVRYMGDLALAASRQGLAQRSSTCGHHVHRRSIYNSGSFMDLYTDLPH